MPNKESAASEQTELFGHTRRVRLSARSGQGAARLHKILAEMKNAQSMPWEWGRASLYHTIFAQMTNWLPDEEGAQLRFQFEEELARLKAA